MNLNKLALTVCLLLIFLGLSRLFTPDHIAKQYVYNESNYFDLFKGRPVSVLLIDAYRIGLLIKTNIHRYKIINIFEGSSEIEIRVSKKFFKKSLPYLGHSVFRRDDKNNENIIPAPPGVLLIGDSTYGRWVTKKSGNIIWKFYQDYDYLKSEFLWGDFNPTKKFFNQYLINQKKSLSFSGINNEFGPNGKITKKFLSMNWHKSKDKKFDFKKYLNSFIRSPLLRKI